VLEQAPRTTLTPGPKIGVHFIILYELLAGRPPFDGESMAEIIIRIATAAPDLLRNLRPDVPEGLESAFRRCTEKDRDRRFANVAELALALLPYGPRPSKVAVEKIVEIIKTSGLSAATLSTQLPLLPQPSVGSLPAVSFPPAHTGSATPGPVEPPTPPPQGPQRSLRRSWLQWAALAVLLVPAVAGSIYWLRTQEMGNIDVHVSDRKGGAVRHVDVYVDGHKRCESAPCVIEGQRTGWHELKVLADGYDVPSGDVPPRVES